MAKGKKGKALVLGGLLGLGLWILWQLGLALLAVKEVLPEDLNVLYKSSKNASRLAKCAPFTADYSVPERAANWYLCENGTCRRAVTDFAQLPLS